ncbi:MAG: dihydrodipicolinate reductase [Veillonellaceae bacterium]|nr:dihydrodipicolinate reductase [Veillonellaceae bacterium]
MQEKIKVVQMGLGPIGNKATQYLVERENLQIVGAVDADPAKVGQDVGTLAGLAPLGVKVKPDIAQALAGQAADVVLLTTSSALTKIAAQLKQVLPLGVHVVSSCEELSYPWQTNPALAGEIDELAKKHGVSVLATGVNPGFLMDFLPIAMTGVCKTVRQVTVERIQDATFRRIPFQKKIGAGLTQAEFQAKVEQGVLRHVGLTESVQMIASRLGWQLESTSDEIAPVVAATDVPLGDGVIAAGKVLGVRQIGRGIVGGREAITLFFRAAIGEPESRDRIIIDGEPSIDSCIKGGVNGDVATCAILINAIPDVMKARPGLRTMADIEPLACGK